MSPTASSSETSRSSPCSAPTTWTAADRPLGGERRRGTGLDALGLPRDRGRTPQRPPLARGAALERPGEHAHGDAVGSTRPEGGDGAGRASPHPLRRAVPGAVRNRVAGAAARSRLAAADRELGARLDLRLLRGRGLHAGARPLLRGRADRHGPRRGRRARGCGRGAHGICRCLQPLADARWDNVELSLGVPARWKDIALELPDGTRVAAQRITRNEPLLYEERVASSGVPEWLRRVCTAASSSDGG